MRTFKLSDDRRFDEKLIDVAAAIEACLQASNNDPKPFVWTATAEEILEKVSRGRDRLLHEGGEV